MHTQPPTPCSALDGILQHHGHRPTELLQILINAQQLEGWLPAPTLTYLAQALRLPRARVEGVAGFYSFLYTRPAGRFRVLFSDNITDRMLGNAELMGGIALIPLMIGMFAISEVLRFAVSNDRPEMAVDRPFGNVFSGMWALLKKYPVQLLRGLGSDNIDSRLRHAEFTQAGDKVRWLGMPIAALSKLQSVLVVGSYLRKDHPLFAARIRQAQRQGAQVFSLNSQARDWALPKTDLTAPAAQWAQALAGIAAAVAAVPAEALRRLSLVSLLATYSTSPSYAYDDHPALIAVQVSQQFKEVSPQKVKMVSYTSRFFESNLHQDFDIVGGVQ